MRSRELVVDEATQCHASPKLQKTGARGVTHAPVTTATRRVYTVPVRWLVVSRSSSPTSSMAPALHLRKTPAISTMWDSPRQLNAAPLNQRPNVLTVHAEPQGPKPLP